MFVEDFSAGIPTYELLIRTDANTGLNQWKRVYVGKCIHSLCSMLNSIWSNPVKSNSTP